MVSVVLVANIGLLVLNKLEGVTDTNLGVSYVFLLAGVVSFFIFSKYVFRTWELADTVKMAKNGIYKQKDNVGQNS